MLDHFADAVVRGSGSVPVLIGSVLIVVVWAAFGPVFNYSETWQLVVNTGTTIVSFWLGFLILRAQRRDTLALQIKLDELIRVTDARNDLIEIEKRPETEIEELRPRGNL